MADILPSSPSALECLEKALEFFRLYELEVGKQCCNTNIAKCLYEKANLILESYGNDESYAPTSRKLFF